MSGPDINDRLKAPIGSDGPAARASTQIREQRPTWREAIVDAHQGIEHAYERRRRVFQAAYDAGLTFRQIGGAAGVSAATIYKIIGSQRGAPDTLLDRPAFQPKDSPGA